MAPTPGGGNGDPPERVCIIYGGELAGVGTRHSPPIRCALVSTVTQALREGEVAGFRLIVIDQAVYGEDTVAACARLTTAYPSATVIVLARAASAEVITRFERTGVAQVVHVGRLRAAQLTLVIDSLLSRHLGRPPVSEPEPAGVSERPARSDEVATTASRPSWGQGLTAFSSPGAATDVRPFQPARDPVTGLVCDDVFGESVGQALARAQRAGRGAIVALIDIDRFRVLSESLGPTGPNRAMAKLSRTLSGALRRGDLLARLGPDRFGLLVESATGVEDASNLADKVVGLLRRTAAGEPGWPEATASVGLVLLPEDGNSPQEILDVGVRGVELARARGGNGYAFGSTRAQAEVARFLDLRRRLQGALARDEFELAFQPQRHLESNRLRGFECLLRWNDPARGRVEPQVFIPVLEAGGTMADVGRWVLTGACQQLKNWQRTFKREDLVVSINLSAQELGEDGLVGIIQRALADAELDPTCLELEVTEDSLLAHPDSAAANLRRLGMLGVSLSIDNFGSGHSSLKFLTGLPLGSLKIDRSFLVGLPADERHLGIVRGTIALGHSLGLMVIAEGVETSAQLACVRDAGCDHAQGFHLGHPGTAEDAITVLAAEADPGSG